MEEKAPKKAQVQVNEWINIEYLLNAAKKFKPSMKRLKTIPTKKNG